MIDVNNKALTSHYLDIITLISTRDSGDSEREDGTDLEKHTKLVFNVEEFSEISQINGFSNK